MLLWLGLLHQGADSAQESQTTFRDQALSMYRHIGCFLLREALIQPMQGNSYGKIEYKMIYIGSVNIPLLYHFSLAMQVLSSAISCTLS